MGLGEFAVDGIDVLGQVARRAVRRQGTNYAIATEGADCPPPPHPGAVEAGEPRGR